ncbi:hypothetical protein INS49_005997 [Diaporthe citri]|uniref:uncharacterized protein n=1 Tax=Diaporthe citri TaxID=83186 RepID=UPI001C7F237C|nr:uncharacterized protein INS49_005997 [Diaporthe citri]KAG6364396.1 hypothetical protein INS49_005997 [Diaporthe citri]
MPPKRKGVAEHAKVPIGRNKIRRGPAGKKLVEETIRKNVLLYLQKLTDEEATNPAGNSFQGKLSSAVAGALDPVVGPEAVADLSSYGFQDLTVFGNRGAGELMAGLLSIVDDGGEQRLAQMQRSLDDETDKRVQAENALAQLQQLIPISDVGQQNLASDLEALEQPVQDAAWLYDILWNACLLWMDARLRQLRSYQRHLEVNPAEPWGADGRARMINARMHGGNLRVDALMAALNFGYYRHHDAQYDGYIRTAFQKMYKLSIADGLWLAKHGNDIARNVDWPQVIGFIDKFVAMYDFIPTSGNRRPPNFKQVLTDRFVPLTAHISNLIGQAKANRDWEADAAARQTITTLQDDLYNDCSGTGWIMKNDPMCLWDMMGSYQPPWPEAAYLRDVPTVPKVPTVPTVSTMHQRTAGQGVAVMRLRPQPRIKYA